MVVRVNMSRVNSSLMRKRSQNHKKQKTDLNYQYPLHIIAVIVGLSCPIELKNYRAKNSLLYKIYALLLIIGIIIGAIYSGIGRYKFAYQYLLQTVKINDVIQQILLGFSTIFAILNVIFNGHKLLNKYFDKMRKIDLFLSTTIDLTRKKQLYYVRFILFHLIIIALAYYDYYGWSSTMGFKLWIFYGFRLFMFYSTMIIVLQIAAVACSIHTRFIIVNERLLDTFLDWIDFYDNETKIQIKREICPTNLTVNFIKYLPIKRLTEIHDLLCDVVYVVNDMFGFNIFLLVSNIIVNCVMSLNIMLIFGTGIQVAKNRDNEIFVLILNAAWAIWFMGLGIAVGWGCSLTSNEGCRTATIAYKLLNLVPARCNYEDTTIRAELFQLAQQVQYRKPAFSAAGFFEVNHAMIYAVMGAISSYIVIIIQFNNSPILVKNNNTTKIL